MSSAEPLLQPIPSNSPEARLATLEAQVKSLLAASSDSEFLIGDWKFTTLLPIGWSSGNLVIEGSWAVPNGYVVAQTNFATLYAQWQARSVTFDTGGEGAGNFRLGDALGRSMFSVGTHTEAGIGDNDGVALANRTAKHNSSVTGGGSGSISGSPGMSDPTHSHTIVKHTFSYTSGGVAGDDEGGSGTVATTSNSTGITVSAGTLSVSGGGTPTVGPGGTRPIDMPAHLVGGIWLLKVQ